MLLSFLFSYRLPVFLFSITSLRLWGKEIKMIETDSNFCVSLLQKSRHLLKKLKALAKTNLRIISDSIMYTYFIKNIR